MAIILEFKLPKNSITSPLVSDSVISSSVNDVMLIIHHALHGTDEACQPKDLQLAAKLLDELSCHIKNDEKKEHLILSNVVSESIVVRYPERIRECRVT